jgi:hypothetical protein
MAALLGCRSLSQSSSALVTRGDHGTAGEQPPQPHYTDQTLEASLPAITPCLKFGAIDFLSAKHTMLSVSRCRKEHDILSRDMPRIRDIAPVTCRGFVISRYLISFQFAFPRKVCRAGIPLELIPNQRWFAPTILQSMAIRRSLPSMSAPARV